MEYPLKGVFTFVLLTLLAEAQAMEFLRISKRDSVIVLPIHQVIYGKNSIHEYTVQAAAGRFFADGASGNVQTSNVPNLVSNMVQPGDDAKSKITFLVAHKISEANLKEVDIVKDWEIKIPTSEITFKDGVLSVHAINVVVCPCTFQLQFLGNDDSSALRVGKIIGLLQNSQDELPGVGQMEPKFEQQYILVVQSLSSLWSQEKYTYANCLNMFKQKKAYRPLISNQFNIENGDFRWWEITNMLLMGTDDTQTILSFTIVPKKKVVLSFRPPKILLENGQPIVCGGNQQSFRTELRMTLYDVFGPRATEYQTPDGKINLEKCKNLMGMKVEVFQQIGDFHVERDTHGTDWLKQATKERQIGQGAVGTVDGVSIAFGDCLVLSYN